MVPRTLISFVADPHVPDGSGESAACTTVSTSARSITLAISGLRMSARTNSTRPIRLRRPGPGGAVSTPSTRPIDGSVASRAARWPPRKRLTPVTRTTEGATDRTLGPGRTAAERRDERSGHLPSLRRCTRVLRSSLRCFFFDIRLRRFLMTEPIRRFLPRLNGADRRPRAHRHEDMRRPGVDRWPTVPAPTDTQRPGTAAAVSRRRTRRRAGGSRRRAAARGRTGPPGRQAARRRAPAGRPSSWTPASGRPPRPPSGTAPGEGRPCRTVPRASDHRLLVAPAGTAPRPARTVSRGELIPRSPAPFPRPARDAWSVLAELHRPVAGR